jgi:octaprenyl-diphosphate synthase
MRIVASSSCQVCEGEMIQNAAAGNLNMGEDEYLRIVSLKTAALCKAACGLGALLSECDRPTVHQFENFGQDLGIAFQIMDDVLDIVGERETVGKTLGTDLAHQKATLPVIHFLAHQSERERRQSIQQICNGNLSATGIRERLLESDSIAYANQAARQRALSALEFATSLPATACSDSLKLLADFVTQRTH